MAARGGLVRRSAVLLCKSETTPGTDPTPTLASNAILGYEVTLNPGGNTTTFTRKLVTGGDSFLGVQTPVPAIRWATLSFKVPCTGAGSAGSAPNFGPALKACGFSETLSGGTRATYRLVATTTTCTFWLYVGPAADLSTQPNWRRYKMNGCAGNVTFTGTDSEPGMLSFEFQGTYVAPTDISDPGDPTLTEVVAEPFLSTGISFTPNGGAAHAPIVKTFEFNAGNNVVARKNLQNASGVQAFIIEDRTPTIKMQVEEELASGHNWWTDYTDSVFGELEVGPIGADAGNIYQITANRAQQSNMPQLTDADGVLSIDTEWQAATSMAALSTSAIELEFT